ncbi:hypothetical protein OIU79_003972 [Salix purpurea]|uniref:Uncharacterized protein n=1 Tax=Salix purpurea TaxID=77065 RepID=A0A9Q0U964_SALPP|nr:hypothetical protein OIU79_003972 [Salix purpurea]
MAIDCSCQLFSHPPAIYAALERKCFDDGSYFPKQKEVPVSIGYPDGSNVPHKSRNVEMCHDTRGKAHYSNTQYWELMVLIKAKKLSVTLHLTNIATNDTQGVPHVSDNQMSTNVDDICPMINGNQISLDIENGNTILLVGNYSSEPLKRSLRVSYLNIEWFKGLSSLRRELGGCVGGMIIPQDMMSAGGWGEKHDRRTRESSYDGDDGASKQGYGDANNEN